MANSTPPRSFSISIRDKEKDENGVAESKCAFLIVALCPCLVCVILLLIVLSIILTVNLGHFGDYSNGGTRNNDEIDECQCENKGVVVNSSVNPEEVERLCKVIDELFAFDSTMEAAVDGCSINLTPDLVVNVRERFRHARKPALWFFNWTVERPGFWHNSRIYNSMMGIIGKAKQSETIVSMEEMDVNRVSTIETFEIAMRAFAEAKKRKKAVGMFKLMKYKYKVVLQTFDSLLDCLGEATLGKEAKAMFGKFRDRFVPNPRTCTVLLDGWCRVKNLMEAGRDRNHVIDKAFKSDVVAHNFMLQGLLKCRKRSDAIKLFEVMKAKALSPNFWGCTILMPYLRNQRMMEYAIDCFDEMVDFGCVLDAPVYTCLITGFENQKSVAMIQELLKKMKEIVCPLDLLRERRITHREYTGGWFGVSRKFAMRLVGRGIYTSEEQEEMMDKGKKAAQLDDSYEKKGTTQLPTPCKLHVDLMWNGEVIYEY
ncbi:hypothetical protein K2173_025193 [Erythroxylum novogranatense]|uniref:Pentatricopeptide repeat-containing protein n=1 Tax=Erythroxylum novogranatense TaxID=1862640 RepID=A0AAV8UIC8_9ROSI|nr:hypothetical protein K2173_025193 [Erythroxylum novogranatense]